MPIYEYGCTKCKEVFSIFQSVAGTGKIKCPKCGCEEVQKKVSSFSCCSIGGGSGSAAPSGGFGGG